MAQEMVTEADALGNGGVTEEAMETEEGDRNSHEVESRLNLQERLETYVSNDLKDPLSSLVNRSLACSRDSASSQVATERLEIDLRQHLMGLLERVADSIHADCDKKDGNTHEERLEAMATFWQESLQACLGILRIVTDAKAPQDKEVEEMLDVQQVRKLPFVMMEDMLESLTVTDCQKVWEERIEPAYEDLFCDLIWTPPGLSQRPCWLPLLKVTNKLLKRLYMPDHALFSAKILILTARVYPLGEKSAIRVWGSNNADGNLTTLEEEDDFEAIVDQGDDATNTANTMAMETSALPIRLDYSLYQSIWKLQHDFANPNRIGVAQFKEGMDRLLTALESNTPPPSQSLSTPASAENSSFFADPVKYLTSSRVLTLQLWKDPAWRQDILIQFLIGHHHLCTIVAKMQEHLAPLEPRARALLPPKLLDWLDRLLKTSEMAWRHWKQTKCQTNLHKTLAAPPKAIVAKSLKRKRVQDKGGDEKDETDYSPLVRTELPTVSQTLGRTIPALQDHLQDYVEALDPESGIEAEYHPKSKASFNWKSLRLLVAAPEHLHRLQKVRSSDGDYEAAVRIMCQEKGIDVPGEMPSEDEDFMEEEEQPEPEEQEEERVEDPMETGQAENEMSDTVKTDGTSGDEDEQDAAQTNGQIASFIVNDDGEVQEPGDDEKRTVLKEEKDGGTNTREESKPVVKEEPQPMVQEESKSAIKEEAKTAVKDDDKPVVKDEAKAVVKEEPKMMHKAGPPNRPSANGSADNNDSKPSARGENNDSRPASGRERSNQRSNSRGADRGGGSGSDRRGAGGRGNGRGPSPPQRGQARNPEPPRRLEEGGPTWEGPPSQHGPPQHGGEQNRRRDDDRRREEDRRRPQDDRRGGGGGPKPRDEVRRDGGAGGGPRDGGARDGGPRDGGPRDGGPRDGGPRDGGPRGGGPRGGGPRDVGQAGGRDGGGREGGGDWGRDGGRDGGRGDRRGRNRDDRRHRR